MKNVILLFVVISLISCTDKKEVELDNRTEKEIHLDSLENAQIIVEDFDTTGVPLYYVPEEYTEYSEKKIFPTTYGDVGVSIIRYCQTKEGIEVNYQLRSGAKFRIHYRDWAGRIIVSKGDSTVNNYSFDKKDYVSLKDEKFWNDKVMHELWLEKMNTIDESVLARFTVVAPKELKADKNLGITIQIQLDSTGKADLKVL